MHILIIHFDLLCTAVECNCRYSVFIGSSDALNCWGAIRGLVFISYCHTSYDTGKAPVLPKQMSPSILNGSARMLGDHSHSMSWASCMFHFVDSGTQVTAYDATFKQPDKWWSRGNFSRSIIWSEIPCYVTCLDDHMFIPTCLDPLYNMIAHFTSKTANQSRRL